MAPLAAFLKAESSWALLAGRCRRTVRSTTDTLVVGTRKAIPVSLPLTTGYTLPTALAAPVVAGMMLYIERPERHFLDGPSTTFYVEVAACTVVMRPSTMPKFS